MRNIKFSRWNKSYHQITKKHAEKLFYNGGSVLACASNLNPAMYAVKLAIVKKDGVPFPENQFEKLCNEVLYYNCINAETGKYIRFYTND